MEKNKKCSFKEHQDIEAVFYCQNCNIYMCNKCDKFHSNIFLEHLKFPLDKNNSNIFTGLCTEKDHLNKLLFFCRNHNMLCCSSCLCKIKKKGYGQHKDCDVCEIEDIKEEKMNKYEENIKYLENLSQNIKESINKLKLIYEKVEKDKEQFISNVQKIFTKLRNALNEREDELLLIINEKYKKLYLDDEIIKENEKLPNQIEELLAKSKKTGNKWNNDGILNMKINQCLEIEKKIDRIKRINSVIKPNYSELNLSFYPNESSISEFIDTIKNFGQIILLNHCSLCYSKNDLRKCLCKKIFCLNCLNDKKNLNCFKSCYLFINKLNYINQVYNISEYQLPKNFEIKLHFTKVDYVRTGITLDKNIKNCKYDSNDPNYEIYYIHQDLSQFYNLKDKWKNINKFKHQLKSDDYMIITMFDGKMKYNINGTSLDFEEEISLNNDNEIYLLIHDRYQKSKCNIEYITEILN